MQFSGPVTSQSLTCPKTTGTLIIQTTDVVFSPAEGTWTLSGKLVGDAVEASRERPSFDHKIYATVLKAKLTDDRVVGTYTTPTCDYAVDLKRF